MLAEFKFGALYRTPSYIFPNRHNYSFVNFTIFRFIHIIGAGLLQILYFGLVYCSIVCRPNHKVRTDDSGGVDKASATETVYSGSIPSLVKPKTKY